jgi:hypothetical protein
MQSAIHMRHGGQLINNHLNSTETTEANSHGLGGSVYRIQ